MSEWPNDICPRCGAPWALCQCKRNVNGKLSDNPLLDEELSAWEMASDELVELIGWL